MLSGQAQNEPQIRYTYKCLFCFFVLEVKRQQGLTIERWDGIDGYLVKDLLADSRFPDMPTIVTYSKQFAQPNNWGTNYGSRIRGYFVPQQTGPHSFFIGIVTNPFL